MVNCEYKYVNINKGEQVSRWTGEQVSIKTPVHLLTCSPSHIASFRRVRIAFVSIGTTLFRSPTIP